MKQLPIRALAGALTALLWGIVTRQAWFGFGVFVIATTSTVSNIEESFAIKLERALVISGTLALVRLYTLRNIGG